MLALHWITWIVVDSHGEQDPIPTFKLLHQQELQRDTPNPAAQLRDLSFQSICELLHADAQRLGSQMYGALLPSETMMRLQNEEQWGEIKARLEEEVLAGEEDGKGGGRGGGQWAVRIGLMESLEEWDGEMILFDWD